MTDMNDWNRQVIDEFRANAGKLTGNFAGAPVLLLHTTGAKTGTERVNPLMFLDHEGRRYVFASAAGAPKDPDWYRNLVANPEVSIEEGTHTYTAVASPITGEARDRIYAEQARRFPNFAEYETKTTRVIPVVELIPTM